MRLIDADRLMYSLRGNVLIDVVPELEETILQQPTAFDKEKVIEELKKCRDFYDINEEPSSNIGSKEYVQECCDIREHKGKWIAYNTAIEIVEKGGIE